MRAFIFLALLPLAACAVPPPEAYTAGRGRPDRSVDLGPNEVGEGCVQSSTSGDTGEVYCGTWQQPSARVRAAGTGPGDKPALATAISTGSWRSNLDATYNCAAPQQQTVGGQPALLMQCTRLAGGWPHIALATEAGGRTWLADGVVSSLPAIAHSVAVLAGRETPRLTSNAAVQALQAQRQGAQSRASGDVREFDALMTQGARANLVDDSAASETAYSAALALQEKALGRDNPNVADPLMHVALQLSNQGRFAEADALFTRAEALARQQSGDPMLVSRCLYYRGLHAYNQKRYDEALTLLRQADAGYVAVTPPDALSARRAQAGNAGLEEVLATTAQRQNQSALAGLVEARRFQAVVLRDMGRQEEGRAMLRSASEVARSGGVDRPELTARLSRTEAVTFARAGNNTQAIAGFGASNSAFARAYPGSRPLALVQLLRARELVQGGQPGAAVPICQSAIKVLQDLRSGFEPERMNGCLDAFAAAAGDGGDGGRQPLLRDMFQAAQLVRGSTTSQQIQQASARLAAGGGGRIGEAIRQQQDAANGLADIRRRREGLLQTGQGSQSAKTQIAALDKQEADAAAALAGRESALQAAAPNYGQLVQQAVTADEVLRTLQPGEAFASIVLAPNAGYTFLLQNGRVRAGRIPGGAGAVDPLVARIRQGMQASRPAFDVAAAQTLHTVLFGDLVKDMAGIKALTVAPTGSLLALPFGVLLTGPADPSALASAPWLVRQASIGHVPSAGNFVALRRVAGASRATRPWFGFGDFHPVSLAQAQRSFPASCGDSASLLARLPPLPSAKKELELARQIVSGAAGDSLLGAAFTAPAVERTDLSNYRVLHFATHALLPSDLKCQTEPALVASPPAGARDAAGALLKASDLAGIKLDADLVILSACNSGGSDGVSGGGESLSTLARSFFYGGARALLITHWEVNDQAATYIVADTLRRLTAEPGLGAAGALRGTQVELLARAGSSLPAEFAHPYYWAPFALIGPAPAPPAGAGQAGAALPLRGARG